MSAQASYSIHDCTHLHVVPVIASFDHAENVVPLYVRINGSRYKIVSCVLKEKLASHLTFNCKVEDGDYQKDLTLVYFYTHHSWAIPK